MSVLVNSYRFGAAGAFAPTDISDLALWADMSDASTLYDATSGGSLSGTNGIVRRIEDKSSNANHLTRSGSEDLRRVAQINGRDVVEIIGAGTISVTGTGFELTDPIAMNGGATIAIVVQRTQDSNGGLHSLRGSTTSEENNHHPFAGDHYSAFGRTNRINWTQAYTSALQHYMEVAGTRWTAYRNNSQLYDTGTITLANQGIGTQRIGCGGAQTGNFVGRGYYCEVCIWPRALTSDERATLHSYFADKWGI